ncbi:type II toxin-antitoxin system PemK/MazF family toxin [Kineosporia sp. J2-2]|uniref:Type II toxin-antitoxin system PemK/MazF family toxin n=1 Tax=Kineosporia corallincola TaxID=2835133 RepID=A0ABS5TMH1_9ACTN|nr:type II toxin-antitoxin system PemK/MazF family toxin [Kineosporia corallincola]MBT0770799.1 type II toxin-antitoxin system PemK/MazF family toxin [Kineosporia corallincola]
MANGFWSTLARLLGLGKPDRSTQTAPRPRAPKPAPTRPTAPKPTAPKPSAPKPAPPRNRPAAGPSAPSRRPQADHGKSAYAGDFTGRAKIDYDPNEDGNADPGEVVWAWVPFEEDHSQGKDRPVLVIARHRGHLLGLMLTSKDHDRDAVHEARYGRLWMDVGTGAWDRQNRPSEVRLDRVLQLLPDAVRREGATMERPLYDQVTTAVRKAKGW